MEQKMVVVLMCNDAVVGVYSDEEKCLEAENQFKVRNQPSPVALHMRRQVRILDSEPRF